MKKLGVIVGVIIGLLIAAFLACEAETPTAATPITQFQAEVVINDTGPISEGGDKPCDILQVVQRRPKSRDSNIVVLEVRSNREFKDVYVKFLTNDGGLPRLLHIERGIRLDEVFEVEVQLPKCGTRYQVFVFVEGIIGDKLIQCDGSVDLIMSCVDDCTTCECRGDCPEPCPEERCNECQTWNPTTCQCEGDCGSECEIPPEHNFSLPKSLGNPGAECGFFDLSATGSGTAVIYITKCGNFYEVTHGPWSGSTCSNGKEVSHMTPCWCKEESDE